MPYIAQDIDHRMASANGWIGVNHECVALARGLTNAPPSSTWRAGPLVRGNTHIEKGTVIATFPNGHYEGHAAIYLGETADGIRVFDQWNAQKAHQRIIHYTGNHAFVDDGNNYYVVE